MAKLAKLFTFSSAELFVLLEAWWLFLKWDFLISFTHYDNWRNALSKLRDANDDALNTSVAFEQVEAIIKLSETAGRFHVTNMNCLRRCIVQGKLLEKRGINTRMHIGVRFEGEQLKAHSWLTLQGKVINDSIDVVTRYSELKANGQQDMLRYLK